jgi:hypothetical protein
VRLSDQGRQQPPGSISVTPRFFQVDPRSESILTVRIPQSIVKLAESPAPGASVQFEEHAIADAVQIDIEIGWSDTPFYADPRAAARAEQPVATWERQTLRLSFQPPSPPAQER